MVRHQHRTGKEKFRGYADRTGLVDVHSAAAGDHSGFAFDDVDFVLAQGETDGTGDLVLDVGVQQKLHDEATLKDVVLADGFLGGFGNDSLVGLAVDHDLPLTGADRLGTALQRSHLLAFLAVQVLSVFGLLPYGKSPFLEQMDGIIDVAAQVEDQVFPDDSHQVVADHADVIVGGVGTDVGIDGGKALRNSATSFHRRFVAKQDRLILGQPFFDLEGRAASSHAATHDQDVNFTLFYFGILNRLKFTHNLVW
jgi:hypothetical protein